MTVRENTAPGLTHPEWVDGRRLWIDPAVAEIVDKLQNGDPTLGWEGDPRLALYFDGAWHLYRHEADGVERRITSSRPGLALDNRLIEHLISHDTRRTFNPVAFFEQEVQRQGDKRTDAVAEAAERVADAFYRDLG